MPKKMNPQKKIKSGYFKLAEGLTESDYLPGTVIFKLKETNRNFAGINSISNDRIEAAFASIGATTPAKIFADASKPAAEMINGERTSDLSLIYIVKYNSGRSMEDQLLLHIR